MINKFVPVVLLLLSASMSACSSSTDKDDVPKVDIHGTIVTTTDAKAVEFQKKWGGRLPAKRMITVEKEQIPIIEFVLKYCQGKDFNETCSRAKMIINIDASSGPKEQLPKGL